MSEDRNLHPHKEAVAAMWLFGTVYAKQSGGSMDFWDSLPAVSKRLCKDMVQDILNAEGRDGEVK